MQFLLPIVLTISPARSPIFVAVGVFQLGKECLLLLLGEELEVRAIKPEGVVVPCLLPIFQRHLFGVWMAISFLVVFILMLVILMLFGSSLLCSASIFVGIAGIRVLAKDFPF